MGAGVQQAGQIHAGAADLQRIRGQRGTLRFADIAVYTVGKRKDQRNTNDANGTGEGGEQGARFFGEQVVEAEGKGGEQGHGRVPHVPVHGGCANSIVLGLVGHGVGADDAVLQRYDAGGVALGQLRVVGDHAHQPVTCHLLEQLHHLKAGLAVQCAGGLVCQQDIGVVHQRTGNGYPLHLPAGHLAGALVQLVAQPHLLQSLGGTAAALGLGNARDSQCQLHVAQHGLVGDQVIALEHKADGVVPVGVPVAVGIFFGGDAVDDKVAAVVAVQTADDVQQRGLAGAAGTQNGHKFVIPQVQTDVVQCVLHQLAGLVFLVDLFEFEHRCAFPVPRRRALSLWIKVGESYRQYIIYYSKIL